MALLVRIAVQNHDGRPGYCATPFVRSVLVVIASSASTSLKFITPCQMDYRQTAEPLNTPNSQWAAEVRSPEYRWRRIAQSNTKMPLDNPLVIMCSGQGAMLPSPAGCNSPTRLMNLIKIVGTNR